MAIISSIRFIWKGSTIRKKILFILILVVDCLSSVLIPVFFRKFNEDTKDLKLCKIESGYRLFSNTIDCLGEEHKISIAATITYGINVLCSLAILMISLVMSEFHDDGNKVISELLDSSKIIPLFGLRNISMFNLANYVSSRSGDLIIIQTVKMEFLPFVMTALISLIISSYLQSTFPTKILGMQRGKSRSIVLMLIFMAWWTVIFSFIYYIGATNVLDRNVLTMYDLRGPELLTLNYWNYGLLLIIFIEYTLLLQMKYQAISNYKLKNENKLITGTINDLIKDDNY
jgi:hypothetical protein